MRYLFLAISLLAISTLYAQQNQTKCGDAYVQQSLAEHYGDFNSIRETFLEDFEQFAFQANEPEGTIYTIPVVVHVIYNDALSNITRDQIVDAIELLNLDYRRLNADTSKTRSIFKARAADIEVQFALAKLDPNGNCTEGITRTFSNLTEGANNNVKSLISWNNKKYLNVWVVKSITLQGATNVLGFATFPVSGGNPPGDGIVIRHDNVGSIGTATAPTLGSPQYGRTLTHESGHYLGLYHTFQGGCFQGDGIADTPPVLEANFGCNLGINSCVNDVPDLPDMIENYMDYADGDCMNMFSVGQKNVMRFTLISPLYRNELVTGNTATATGIAQNQVLPCLPTPDFTSDRSQICEGDTVQFLDRTYMGNPTSYLWTFAGGIPATSTSQNPTVAFATKGNYAVTLTTTNANGSTNLVQNGFISVRSQTNTPYVNSFGDDFELYPIPNENWHVVPGLDTMNFRYFNKSAFAGSSCVTVQNFNAVLNEADAMISHSIIVANSKSLSLTFKYAFAERLVGNTDALRIYVSDDCGENWELESTRIGPFLRTTNIRINDTAWYPTLANNWAMANVSLDKYAYNTTPIMIKFEFKNGGGNNFYLDEVLLTTTIGTKELFADDAPTVYPNPAHNFVTVDLPNSAESLFISDITGRVVLSQALSTTEKIVVLPLTNFAPGLYFISINQGAGRTVHKIIVH